MMDDKFFDSIQEIRLDMGRVLQGQEDLKDYIKTVSQNTKEISKKLEDHSGDDEAHGIKTLNRSRSNIFAWMGIGTGLGVFLLEAIKSWFHH